MSAPRPSETLLVSHPAMLHHDMGHGHPERPDRLTAVVDTLKARGLPGVRWERPQPITDAALTRIHPQRYVDFMKSLGGKHAILDGDTRTSPGSIDAAYLAAGAAVHAVDAVLAGDAKNAFAFVRPPGHHAEAQRPMGFCLFNNIAVAAAHACAQPGIERVMIIDWDVHHGNGTQHAFYERRDVAVFNTHRFPFYPGTGALHESGRGAGEGFTVNVPMPAELGDGDFEITLADLAQPVAERFRPDLVLVSAGFDAHRDDPLADQRVTDDGFATLCAMASQIADAYANGRLVLVLEGGYDLGALARSVTACVQVMTGATPPPTRDPSLRGMQTLKAARAAAQRYWRV